MGLSVVIPVFAMLFLDPQNQIFGSGFTDAQIMMILGLLKASYPLFQLIGAPFLGNLSDRIGRKPVLIITLSGTLLGYLLIIYSIFTQNIYLLFAGRIIDGITGGNIVVLYSVIADVSDPKQKASRFGLIGMAFGLGFIFGPFLGGLTSSSDIISWFNYTTPFVLSAVLVAINLLFILSRFPETRISLRKEKLRFYAGIRDFFKLLSNKELSALFLVFFLFIMGFTFYTQFYDVFLISKFDFNQQQIGNVFAYIGLWIVLSQGYLTGKLSQYFNAGKVIFTSFVVLAITLLILLIPDDYRLLFIILPFVSVAHGLIQPNLLGLISNSASADFQGKVIGFSQSLQSIGYAIPPLISGFVIALNLNLPIIISACFISLAFIFFLVFRFFSK